MIIRDEKTREKIKNHLVTLSVSLASLLVILLFYWAAFIRLDQIQQAMMIGHYKLYSMHRLPDRDDKIDAKYHEQGVDVLAQGLMQDLSSKNNLLADKLSKGKKPNNNNLEKQQITEEDNADMVLATTDAHEDISDVDKQDKETVSGNDIANGMVKPNIVQNKKYHVPKDTKPRIAIIVTGLGLNKKNTELALTLPKECALGFFPYTKILKSNIEAAQKNGHEIFIYLPMQTAKSYDDPGKHALKIDSSDEENQLRINIILNAQNDYDGLYSSHKEACTKNRAVADLIFKNLDKKNLIFISGKNFGSNMPKHLLNKKRLVVTDLILDEDPDKESIKEKLNELIKIAQEENVAVAYAQGYPLTTEIIKDWLPKLKKHGIQLVPVSDIFKEHGGEQSSG